MINDKLEGFPIVLVGNEKTRTVRAYKSNGEIFTLGKAHVSLVSQSGNWKLTEDALISDSGEKLERLPGHISYWFAWNNYSQAGSFDE